MNRSCPRLWVVWILILAQVIISPEAEAEAIVEVAHSHIRQAMEQVDSDFCPKHASDCGSEMPTCTHKNQTRLPLTCSVCPGGTYWVCLYVNCDNSTFDREHPKDCCTAEEKRHCGRDCNEEPVERIDCGCPVWQCQQRNCSEVEQPTCNRCQELKFTRKCGCDVAECVQKKPRKCPNDCGACNECVSQPFKPVGCHEDLGEMSYCQPKKCPEQRVKCDSCQQLKRSSQDDECGCPQYECVDKKIFSFCDAGEKCSNSCNKCTFMPEPGCPRTGTKQCIPRTCDSSNQSPLTCPKCKEPKTKLDECGCPTHTCEWKAEVNNCGRDCAGDGCKQCKKTSTCTDDNGIERAFVSQCVPIPPPPTPVCQGNCTEPRASGEHKCGRPIFTCQRKQCVDLSPIPRECPEEDCMEPHKKTDECGCYEWACRPKPPQPKPETCGAGMSPCKKCQICRLVPSGSCGAWESACFEGCPPPPEEKSHECWNPPQFDECKCPMPQSKKECPSYPEPQSCKHGERLVEGSDVCGCPRRTCLPCPARPNCTKCEESITYGWFGGCMKTVCRRKSFQTPEKTCPRCYVLDLTSTGPCGEDEILPQCLKLNFYQCQIRFKDDPKEQKDCDPEGKTLSIWKDDCGCERRACDDPPICKPEGLICDGNRSCNKYDKCPESCTGSSSPLNKLIAA